MTRLKDLPRCGDILDYRQGRGQTVVVKVCALYPDSPNPVLIKPVNYLRSQRQLRWVQWVRPELLAPHVEKT